MKKTLTLAMIALFALAACNSGGGGKKNAPANTGSNTDGVGDMNNPFDTARNWQTSDDLSAAFKNSTGSGVSLDEIKGKSFFVKDGLEAKTKAVYVYSFDGADASKITVYSIDRKFALPEPAQPAENASEADRIAWFEAVMKHQKSAYPVFGTKTSSIKWDVASPSALIKYTPSGENKSVSLEHLKLTAKNTPMTDGRLKIDYVRHSLAGDSMQPYPINIALFTSMVELAAAPVAGAKLGVTDSAAYKIITERFYESTAPESIKRTTFDVQVIKNHKGKPEEGQPFNSARNFETGADPNKTACTDYGFQADDKLGRMTFKGQMNADKDVFYDLYYNKTNEEICDEIDFSNSISKLKGSDSFSKVFKESN